MEMGKTTEVDYRGHFISYFYSSSQCARILFVGFTAYALMASGTSKIAAAKDHDLSDKQEEIDKIDCAQPGSVETRNKTSHLNSSYHLNLLS